MVIVAIFPFQCIYGHVLARYDKNKLSLFCKLIVAPYWLWERLFKGGWGRYVIYQIGLVPSCHLRKFAYKAMGCQVAKKVVFHYKTEIRYPWKLRVERGAIIGDNVLLDARNGLTIGSNVNISSNVSIYTEQHDHRDPFFRCVANLDKEVVIGDRVWLGSNVIVLPGVKIGEGAVCCAGCVVTKDIEPYSVVAGIPAKKVNERPSPLYYEFDGSSCRLY